MILYASNWSCHSSFAKCPLQLYVEYRVIASVKTYPPKSLDVLCKNNNTLVVFSLM